MDAPIAAVDLATVSDEVEIRAAAINVFYLFDVAQALDLAAVRQHLGPRARAARLDDKAAGPPPIRYSLVSAPVECDGGAFGADALDGFRVRVKFYDYGVISLLLSRPFSGSWNELIDAGVNLIESEPLEQHAAEACAAVVKDVRHTLTNPRDSVLGEDYLVFAITNLEPRCSGDEMLRRHGADIAQLLRGERQLLSLQEREEVLKSRLSYLADDLVVPAWNAAFVYDTEAAAAATMEIMELANSHLLEFRYHDDLLDDELARIYAELEKPRWLDRWVGRRHERAARHVQSLVIDVNELTDRMENAVKFVGDIYSARLFGNLAHRLGLDRWKRNVDEKLTTLSDIYRFAVEQTSISQANTLEAAITLICAIELWLLVAGIAK